MFKASKSPEIIGVVKAYNFLTQIKWQKVPDVKCWDLIYLVGFLVVVTGRSGMKRVNLCLSYWQRIHKSYVQSLL